MSHPNVYTYGTYSSTTPSYPSTTPSYPPTTPSYPSTTSSYPSTSSYTHYQYGLHNPPTPTTPLPSYSLYQPPQPLKSSPPPDLPPPPPDLTSVDPKVAFKAVERLLSSLLRDAGFDAAHPVALERLYVEVVSCTSTLPWLVSR